MNANKYVIILSGKSRNLLELWYRTKYKEMFNVPENIRLFTVEYINKMRYLLNSKKSKTYFVINNCLIIAHVSVSGIFQYGL